MGIETASEPEKLASKRKTGWARKLLVLPLKNFWKSGQFMSFSALLISLGTFITFAYQNYLIQKQQYRSVLPYLMLTNSSGYNEKGNQRYEPRGRAPNPYFRGRASGN